MKLQNLIGGIVLLAVFGSGAWWIFARQTAVLVPSIGANDSISALVSTVAVHQEAMPLTINVFGEIVPGKTESLSFAKAGQVAQIRVVPGQSVHRGEPIALLESDPATQAAYAQAVTAVSFAQRELLRTEDLLALQLATRSQVDSAAKLLRDAQSALATQVKSGGGQTLVTLLAPFDAVVTAIPVMQGDRILAGTAIVQLGRVDNLRVQLAIDPAQSGQVRVGQAVLIEPMQVNVDSLTAGITEIQNMVDPKTQMVGAYVALRSGRHVKWLIGMRVLAHIELEKLHLWSVPRQAVLSDEKSAFLYQVVKGVAHRVNVHKAIETGTNFGVEGSLDAALPVVLQGNYELHDGMRVREGAL